MVKLVLILAATLCGFFAASSMASAFVVGPSRHSSSSAPPSSFCDAGQATRPSSFVVGETVNGLPSPSMAASASSTTSSATDFVRDLLEGMADGGQLEGSRKLLESSSESWKKAIYDAVGAPETADPNIVAKALGDAMSKRDNQFAILVGNSEFDYELEFPSDPVEYEEDGSSFVEVRLRDKKDSELLVTMGVQLQQGSGGWLVSKLDWQDFRDEFYPGLSGREWLRSF